MERVWKPLDVGGLRLYQVEQITWSGGVQLYKEIHLVIASSPKSAGDILKKLYEGYEWASHITRVDYIGKAITVLMPESWWQNGIPS